jgi:hypothetical protein
MNNTNIKILRIISRTAFWSLIGIIVLSIFFKPLIKIISFYGILLFCTAVVFEVLYHIISNKIEAKIINDKRREFIHLTSDFYNIADKKTGFNLGKLSRENVDFLRKKFLEQNMDDNDFYFLSETLELFLKEEKPGKELSDFLKNAMKDKNELELHWEPIKNT